MCHKLKKCNASYWLNELFQSVVFTLSYVIPCLHVSNINIVIFRHFDYLNTYVDKYEH